MVEQKAKEFEELLHKSFRLLSFKRGINFLKVPQLDH